MSLTRRLLLVGLIIVLLGSAWVWWNRPRRIDMAAYAPSDSLVYLECNNLLDIGEAVVNTAAWNEFRPLLGINDRSLPGKWVRGLITWTGIGPTPTVILARTQVAVVVLELGATEKDESLTIKPEAAILLETHTSERRIRPVVEDALRRFAASAMQGATLQRRTVSDAEFIVWSAPDQNRQIVATINGSLVIVGNNERAVQTCLDVQRGLRPNLQSHQELQQMRTTLKAEQSLAFGFVSSANSGRLISAAAPLVTGTAPGDLRFDRLIAAGASRVLGSVGWSSGPVNGGIEDRYLFVLTPNLVSRLRSFFKPTQQRTSVLDVVPDDVHSVTVYKFEDPFATWQAVQTGVSTQLDTLSTIVFTSVLKASLSSYGIEEPDKFLRTVGPELITTRLRPESERSVLIGAVRDEVALRQVLFGQSGGGPKGPAEVMGIPNKETAASFLNGNVLVGPEPDVRLSVSDAQNALGQLQRLEDFLRDSSSAGVATATRDDDRVLSFMEAVRRINGAGAPANAEQLSRKLDSLPYSVTQTTLGEQGLERRTKSSFGQFGSLLPLLFPAR